MITPAGQGSLLPFFLGVAIGLELRIWLRHMFLIGLRRSGSVFQRFLLAQIFVFALQALLLLRRCPIYTNAFFGSIAPLVFPSSLSLPSEGWEWGGGSRDALVLLPEGFPLLPLDFGPAGGVEEPLVAHSVHGSSLLSPQFIRGLGIQEWLSCGGLLLPSVPVGSPSSTLHARRGVGEGESSGGFFSILGCLSRLISARSARWWGG